MTLIQITDDVWAAEGGVALGPGLRSRTRMTVVRLPSHGLLLHSPIEIDAELATAISALGKVEHLVAPNLFHHLFLRPCQQRWPDAQTWAPAGLDLKVKGLRVDEALATATSWLDAFDVFALEGMPKFREFVFFHQSSKTLLVSDLVFNRPYGATGFTRLAFRLAGTYNRLAVSRLFKSLIKDKNAFRASLKPLLKLPIERVVMAHGDVLAENARDLFRQTLEDGGLL